MRKLTDEEKKEFEKNLPQRPPPVVACSSCEMTMYITSDKVRIDENEMGQPIYCEACAEGM